MLLLASPMASADGTSIRVRQLGEARTEPWLHFNATTLDSADAEGGIMDGRALSLDLGPRARLTTEGKWWQTGLTPGRFSEDLHVHGWRAGAELSYDLGPFRVGVNASMSRSGDSTHRMVGLFAYRAFRLSRWMHAWILFGVAVEQWSVAGLQPATQGVNVGLTLGTTFR